MSARNYFKMSEIYFIMLYIDFLFIYFLFTSHGHVIKIVSSSIHFNGT